MTKLEKQVALDEASGSLRCDSSLGVVAMPEGFALMLDPDRMFFYWLREDGTESAITWDKWAVYRGAKEAARDE
ncbi:MAG: hypothetical protein RLN67_02120 [Algiphilus sp.]|uniref:hypothetical protein n=1 Tax=Algiphilus sp. TaxID=1872431 RepID=UPI0032EFA9A7